MKIMPLALFALSLPIFLSSCTGNVAHKDLVAKSHGTQFSICDLAEHASTLLGNKVQLRTTLVYTLRHGYLFQDNACPKARIVARFSPAFDESEYKNLSSRMMIDWRNRRGGYYLIVAEGKLKHVEASISKRDIYAFFLERIIDIESADAGQPGN